MIATIAASSHVALWYVQLTYGTMQKGSTLLAKVCDIISICKLVPAHYTD